MASELKKLLVRKHKLVLFGKGMVGKHFLAWLKLYGLDNLVQAFVVSEPDNESFCMGTPVIGIDHLYPQYKGCKVIICVTEKFRDEIIDKLNEYKISNYIYLDGKAIRACMKVPEKYRKEKIYSVLGRFYGLKYRMVYYLHKKTYIKLIGKRKVRLKLYGKNYYMRMFSRDLDFFESIYIGEWNPEKGCVGEYDVRFTECDGVLDLGANIGLFTFLAASKNPNKKIVALEPERGNYQLLLRNTKCFDNVTCLNKGVWYKNAYCKVYPGRVRIYPSNTPSEGSFYIGECNRADKEAIQAVSIEFLLAKYNLKKCLIKMDIEGAEREIFRLGTGEWLTKCEMLVIETHERFFNDNSGDEILKFMKERGYDFHTLGENKIFRKISVE